MPPVSFTFIGGKGGVGKTTCAAAMAIAEAEVRKRRVLVVSTDPAHSLGDALAMRLTSRPRRVGVTRGSLRAVELDADRALHRWLDAHRAVLVTIAEHGTYLDRQDVERFFDLSFPGVGELLAIREIERLASSATVDVAIVDTAPTGHTLRLLATPEVLDGLARVLDDLQAKHRVLVEAVNRRYQETSADRFIETLRSDAARLAALLRDAARTRFVWVTLAETLAVAETRDALAALEHTGIAVGTLIVNRATEPAGGCAACAVDVRAERAALARLGTAARGKRLIRVPLLAREPTGIAALRRVGRWLDPPGAAPRRATPSVPRASAAAFRRSSPQVHRARPRALIAFVNDPPRLTFVMGKGGVGKTACAAALALRLATRHRDRRVLLLSIDPAPSVGDVLDQPIGNRVRAVRGAPRLFARELDANAEFERTREAYCNAVDDLFDRLRGDSRFDAVHDRQIARDFIELAPPGLDELFALMTIVDLVSDPGADEARERFDHVVIDSAPTGHALRLFELRAQAREWVRTLMSVLLKYAPVVQPGALAEQLVAISRGLRALDALLADPRGSHIVPVTRAAALPRLETLRLVRALDELHLGDPPFAIVNAFPAAPAAQGFSRRSRPAPSCPACRVRLASADAEFARLRDALEGCAIILAPAIAPPPRGVRALARWIDRWRA